MTTLLEVIPKVELHIHIEGTLEPELMFTLAKRNGITLPYHHVDELRSAYQFNCLQEFLDVYYQGMQVLCTANDFFDLTMAYMQQASQQHIRHTEIFFDPQAHLQRGISFSTVFEGIQQALQAAAIDFNISSKIILCFLRDKPESDAFEVLQLAHPYREHIVGVGLDSAEQGNPPRKFQRVFKAARDQGYRAVAHLGEECPPEFIKEGLQYLQVDRIDHGIQAIHDTSLVHYLVEKQIPLTMCPLSNLKLGIIKSLSEHPIKSLLEQGVCVTINSDDPAYFGGYLLENYQAMTSALQLDDTHITALATNAINASFLDTQEKTHLHHELAHKAKTHLHH